MGVPWNGHFALDTQTGPLCRTNDGEIGHGWDQLPKCTEIFERDSHRRRWAAMMDEIEQRALFKFLVRKLKDCRRELTVHGAFAEELRERGYQDVDHILKMFRAEPMLDETLDLHFAWLERLADKNPNAIFVARNS